MKAIIYARISKSNAHQSTSRQINELKEIEDFKVVRVFKESISGYTRSMDEREELQNAISYAKENNIDAILVHEISRLGRKTHEILTLLENLKKKGIKVYVKSLGILINGDGPTEAINKLIITLLADLARMESEQLSFRIKSGLQERKRSGKTIGRQLGSVESQDRFLSKHKSVVRYLDKGESIRWIATKLQMSPTTVVKVKSIMKVA